MICHSKSHVLGQPCLPFVYLISQKRNSGFRCCQVVGFAKPPIRKGGFSDKLYCNATRSSRLTLGPNETFTRHSTTTCMAGRQIQRWVLYRYSTSGHTYKRREDRTLDVMDANPSVPVREVVSE